MNLIKVMSILLLGIQVSGCAATPNDFGPFSDRRITGPANYTVDWDLPETGEFWLPKETEEDIMPAAQNCGAPVESFLYHHWPRPPQYSYFGFRFNPSATDDQKSCVVSRLRAVPALTVYPKKK